MERLPITEAIDLLWRDEIEEITLPLEDGKMAVISLASPGDRPFKLRIGDETRLMDVYELLAWWMEEME
jgi:hypothetical protein